MKLRTKIFLQGERGGHREIILEGRRMVGHSSASARATADRVRDEVLIVIANCD